ncbi:hypothetical protein GCM10027443_07490 [Pontibacter brevis]
MLAFLPLSSGCNYYRVQSEETVTGNRLSTIPNYKRFLVHQGNKVWELRDVTVKEQALEGTLHPVSTGLLAFINPKPGSPNRYRRNNKGIALNLVHLHIYQYAQGDGNTVSIPMNAIQRMDITDMDTGATVASHALTTVGILAGTMAIITIIVLLTKSSCPYVYAYNGEHFEFVGESYGGAIFSPLERHDYIPLPQLKANQENLQVKIANELKERQYTNLAELLVQQHPEQVRVLLDQQGKPHTLAAVQAPVAARSADGMDYYTTQLFATDSSSYLFNHGSDNVNQLNLKFTKPTGAKQAKLLLHARNSLWLDYLYGSFIEQFGASYTSWAEKQKDVPAKEHEQWQKDQGIPLTVEVETAQGWLTVGQVPTVGPLAGRDMVIPFDLAGVKGDVVNVRLSCGFMFWEVDQAGIDYSLNVPVEVRTIKASRATDRQGWDTSHLLAADDNQYLKQFAVGEEVLLTYTVPPATPGKSQSSFLHTKGYYEHIRKFEGVPNILNLMAFKRPGRFIEFSRERYQQIISSEQLNALSHAPVVTP